MKSRRPYFLWLICLLFLLIAFANILQVFRALQSWNVLLAIGYKGGPIVPVIKGVVFALLFTLCAVLLWLRLSWAPAFASVGLLVASIWFWLDRTVFSMNPVSFLEIKLPLILFSVVLIFLLVSLWTLKPFMVSSSETSTQGAGSSIKGRGKDETESS